MDYSIELSKISKKLKLLHAEDDEIISSICSYIFEEYFESSDIAMDGQIALDMFHENDYDLIITDFDMPKINGLDLIKEIRKVNKKIPIMILSGYLQEFLLSKVKEENVFYVKKPFDPDHLIKVIYEMIQSREINKE